jgi:hypothetical protein
MAYHSDNVATAIDDQQSTRQIHLSRYGARPANYSSVQIGQSCIQDRHDRCMFFDPTCDLDHSALLLKTPYRHGDFLTPESFSATSPSAAARSYTSAISDVPCPPNDANVNMRKERRRAQNRVAQRGT